MFNLYELEQFVAFGKSGSLSKVSEELHISSPTLSRSMQNVEREFGVSLFNRTKNRLTLNETGKLAVEEAKKFLNASDDMMHHIRDYDESLKSVSIISCAPVPLWMLLNDIGSIYPNLAIHSSLYDINNMNIETQENDIYILPYKIETAEYRVIPYIKEQLYVSAPKDHKLAGKKKVSFKELNGYDFLLRSEVGLWENLSRQHMPDSKFFIQNDEYAIFELIKNSSIPNFVSNYTMNRPGNTTNRVVIPVSDACANIQFYLYVKETRKLNTIISMLTEGNQ